MVYTYILPCNTHVCVMDIPACIYIFIASSSFSFSCSSSFIVFRFILLFVRRLLFVSTCIVYVWVRVCVFEEQSTRHRTNDWVDQQKKTRGCVKHLMSNTKHLCQVRRKASHVKWVYFTSLHAAYVSISFDMRCTTLDAHVCAEPCIQHKASHVKYLGISWQLRRKASYVKYLGIACQIRCKAFHFKYEASLSNTLASHDKYVVEHLISNTL